MTDRERVLAALNFQESDRIAVHDGPWATTIARWHQEGLPEGTSPEEHFGYALMGVNADPSMRLPTEVVEETDEYTIIRGADGATDKNWKHATSTPGKTDFLIKTRADWEEYKPRMAWAGDRINWDSVHQTEQAARAAGKWFYYSGAFGYDRVQAFVGSERLLMAMVEEPEWVEDMFMTCAHMIVASAEEMIAGGLELDGAFVYDDLGYRNASLFSPAMFQRFEFPGHKLVYDCFHAHGLKVLLHSCGRVSGLIPQLLEAGLNCLQPLEVKAGMDLVALKQQYGDRLAFMGGIDVRCMADPDPTAIEREIATKIPAARAGGGYIYHSDHSVPDNVSFAQYQRTIELVHRYGTY